jgi:ABC-type multidrug transport system fused ATPase/permease subunit
VRLNQPGLALLLRELRGSPRPLVWILLWSVVECLPALVSGLVVSRAVDHFLAGDAVRGLGYLALLLVTAAIGAAGTRQLFPWLAAVIEPVRDAFLTAVVRGAVPDGTHADQQADTATVARLGEQVQAVREVLFVALRVVRQILFSAVAALVGLALLSPAVALLCATCTTVALTLFALLLPGLARRHRAVLLAEEEVARRAGAAFGGIRDAIACGAVDRAAGEVASATDAAVANERDLARRTALRSWVVFLGAQLPLVVLLAAAPWLLREGHLTPGALVGAVTYVTVGLEPALRRLVEAVATWGLEMAVSIVRLGEGFPDPRPEQDLVPAPAHHDLEVRGLTFAYGPHAAPVVRDLDLVLPEGGHLAVVGPSGTGKSTLANLLVGLLPPERGSVRLGGVDIRDIRSGDLRRLLGLIPQEAYVFAGTLRENLTYLAPRVGDRAVTAAAGEIGLTPLLERLSGLDARVGAGGVDLSAGEKQLIALTRVYLSPAAVVVLDEATSSLDPVAEARAEAAFARRHGSLLVIAHRLSSAVRADQVLLLDGDTTCSGSHDELVRTSALYADLVGHWDLSSASLAPRTGEAA